MGNKALDSKALYNVALECARLNNEGCQLHCETCQYNIFNYGLPVNEASLLKANAFTDFYFTKSIKDEARLSENFSVIMSSIALIAMCLLIFWSCSSIKSCVSPNPKDVVRDVDVPEAMYLRNHRNDLSNIPLIFDTIKKYGVPDMNQDGLIDCIDYALWFRLLYGTDARLVINNNRSTGMNHMFILIISGYDFLAVEPQGDKYRYSMGSVWGNKYDERYNQDVTSKWGQAIR